jgi:hypothetical protein
MSSPTPEVPDTDVDTAAAAATPCGNCGTPLLGPHCYACGQPVKGLVRHFSSILGDFADTVFNVDGRIFRTLGPMFFKPGYLSIEYFAGRRVRYVSPVRLLVFVSLITFFFAHWAMPDFDGENVRFGNQESAIAQARTRAEVEALQAAAIAELDRESARMEAEMPGLGATLEAARQAVNEAAVERIAEIEGERPAESSRPRVSFNGGEWDRESNPIAIAWLPQFANDWLNDRAAQMEENAARIERDPNLLRESIFRAAPTALFLLVPVFALLLKLAYLFKRRLYMEHLIVALHSHAFLSASVLLLIVLVSLQSAIGPGFFSGLLGWLMAALWIWMPVNLLITQKRVYGQGWIMTLLKYGGLGFVHFLLLVGAMVFTMIMAIVWL